MQKTFVMSVLRQHDMKFLGMSKMSSTCGV